MSSGLLATNGYQGSFGSIDFIAPVYTGMILQSAPEVDQFMVIATAAQLAQLEDAKEVACVKEALIEISSRPPAASSPAAPAAKHPQ